MLLAAAMAPTSNLTDGHGKGFAEDVDWGWGVP